MMKVQQHRQFDMGTRVLVSCSDVNCGFGRHTLGLRRGEGGVQLCRHSCVDATALPLACIWAGADSNMGVCVLCIAAVASKKLVALVCCVGRICCCYSSGAAIAGFCKSQ